MAWANAVKLSEQFLDENPGDVYSKFNLSVALYKTGDYERSVKVFEEIEDKISARTLWYQIEPILAYYQLKDYDRVFSISDQLLTNQNRAFSELYILRGKIYEQKGQANLAKLEFDNAKKYNKNIDINDPLILR